MRLLIGNVPFSVAHYVEPTCGGTPRSDRRSLAPFAVVFELRQSPLHWNNRGCKVFSVVATQTAKPSALRSKRLCLVPSVLFSRTASGGCRNWLVKQCGYFHIHPKRPSRGSRGTPSPDAVMIAFTQLCSRSALRFLQNVTVWPDFLNRRRDSNTDDDGFLRTDKMREKQKCAESSNPRRGAADCCEEAAGAIARSPPSAPRWRSSSCIAQRWPPSPSIRRSSTRTGNGGRTTCRCPKRARGRRFPPPWSVEVLEACFVVKDSSKPAVWAKAAIRPHLQMKLVIQLYQGRRTA